MVIYYNMFLLLFKVLYLYSSCKYVMEISAPWNFLLQIMEDNKEMQVTS